MHDVTVDSKFFKIRPADSKGHRSAATMLINKMYSWRGYQTTPGLRSHPNRISLVASNESHTIGTLTLGLDSGVGLLADELYKAEIDELRGKNRVVCELTKLAIEQNAGSKRVLASLFHISYIYGRIMNRVTDVLIEVNPRHVNFYRRMLGFNQLGTEQMCQRVNAPAILLWLELDYVDTQIAKFGGKLGEISGEKSLYPYFFSKREELGITKRILEIN